MKTSEEEGGDLVVNGASFSGTHGLSDSETCKAQRNHEWVNAEHDEQYEDVAPINRLYYSLLQLSVNRLQPSDFSRPCLAWPGRLHSRPECAKTPPRAPLFS